MKVREGSGGLPKVSKRVGRPAQRSERSRETPPGGPGGVWRTPQRSGKGWEATPEV